MQLAECTPFAGVVGGVTRRTLRWTGLVTGFVALFVVFACGFLFGAAGAPMVGQVVGQAIVALFLARFAVNGYAGELGGTVFSSAGGAWSDVFPVALRYMALTATWVLPLAFLGLFSLEMQTAVAGSMLSGGSPAALPGLGKIFAVLALYMLLSTLTPPMFLIVSVTAGSFGDVFSPAHWREQFGGRLADLFMVYVVYAGALAMTIVLALPILLALVSVGWPLALLAAIAAGLFGFGVMIDLLGRLSGFFAAGDGDLAPTRAVPTPPTERPAPAAPSDPAGHGEPSPASVPVSMAPDPATAGRPPLDDASGHVQAARRRFAEDPDAAVAALEELCATHAPHPQVLHALWAFLVQVKRADRALEVAGEALPVLLARGSAGLAAQMVKVHWKERDRLGLTRDALHGIAAAMVRDGDLAFAANTYALVLQADKRDARAIKGILGIAERMHTQDDKPADAVRLYRYLLATAPESPLAEFAQQGLEQASAKAPRAEAG